MAGEDERNADCAHRILDYILENWSEDPVQGFEAVLTGSPETPAVTDAEKGEQPPFWSVKARQFDLLSLLLNRLIADLEKNNLLQMWIGGGADFERDVARSLWQVDSGASQSKSPSQAVAMAQMIGRYQELARKAQNRFSRREAFPAGLISDSHDPLRLRRAGKEEWSAFIQPLLEGSWLKGLGNPREILGDCWELITQEGHVDLPFRFRDADSWTYYNRRFGFGTLREAVVSGLERAARRAGMLEVFGSDPQMLKGMIFALGKGGLSIEEEAEAHLQVRLAGLAPVRPLGLHHPALELDIAETATAELIDLAAAMFPDTSDLSAFGEDVPFRDATLLAAIDADLIALAAGSGIASASEKAVFAGAVSVFCRGFKAMLAEHFEAGDNPPGRATGLLRQFLKLDVFHWWREASRRATLLALRMFVSEALKRRFTELDPALASALKLYGITAAGWEMQRADNGLVQRDASYSASVAQANADALDAYLWERLMFVALPSDAPNHAELGRGLAESNAEGGLLRFLAQFRSYGAPVVKLLGGRDAKSERAPSDDRILGFANAVVWLVVLERLQSFASAAAQGQALKGKDVVWFDSASNSGALGLCADFLFAEITGMNLVPISALATLRHPAIAPALAVWHRARNAEDARAALATWAEKQGHEDGDAPDRLRVLQRGLNAGLRHLLQKAAD